MTIWHPLTSLSNVDGLHAIAFAIIFAAVLRAIFNK